jgi:predicted acyltransferase
MSTAELIPVHGDLEPDSEQARAEVKPIEPAAPEMGKTLPLKSFRLHSLDVFRGITIAGMLLVNNPGKGVAFAPLEHADWHGWTPTDLIFPFFLFIVGVAIPFSLAKRRKDPSETTGRLIGQIWLRALSLFMLGELLTGFPMPLGKVLPDGFSLVKALRAFSFVFVYASLLALLIPWRWRRVSMLVPPIVAVVFYLLLIVMFYVNKHALSAGWPAELGFGGGVFRPERLRIPGVLQRIGICYGVAATIAVFAGWRMVTLMAIVLMAGYSALMLAVPYPNHTTGLLTKEDNLARHIDVAVLDSYRTTPDGARQIIYKHSYGPYPDNEGILSTIPAIATVLLGILVGTWLRSSRPAVDRCLGMMGAGVMVTILGCALNSWLMPINKNLWTPSFVVFTAGMAMLGLGTVFWLVDVLQRRRWALPFTIFGMNAIAAFVAAGIVTRLALLIKVHDARHDKTIALISLGQSRIADGVAGASVWLQHISVHLPTLNTPGLTSLAYSLCYILVILLLMSVLYVCKIFVKV